MCPLWLQIHSVALCQSVISSNTYEWNSACTNHTWRNRGRQKEAGPAPKSSGFLISYNRENCLKLASLNNSDNEGKRKILHSCMPLPILFSSSKNYYLDEFSSLLDELLVKIDGLSDGLELSSLENQWRRTVESRTEESPLVGIPGYHATAVRLRKLFFLTFYTAIFIF